MTRLRVLEDECDPSLSPTSYTSVELGEVHLILLGRDKRALIRIR